MASTNFKKELFSFLPSATGGILALLAFLFFPLFPGSAQVQLGSSVPKEESAKAPAATLEETEDSLRKKISEIRVQMGVLTLREGGTQITTAAKPMEIEECRINYELILNIYEEHIDLLSIIRDLCRQEDQVTGELEVWNGFKEKPPFSVLLIDDLRGELEKVNEGLVNARHAGQLFETTSAGSRSILRTAQVALRQVNEKIEVGKNPAELPRLYWERLLFDSRIKRGEATLSLVHARTERLRLEVSCLKNKKKLLEQKIQVASKEVYFPEEDLKKILSRINRDRAECARMVEVWVERRMNCQKNADICRDRLQKALLEVSSIKGGTPEQTEQAKTCQQEMNTLGAELDAISQVLATLRRIIEMLVGEHGLWKTRYELFHSPDPALQMKIGQGNLAQTEKYTQTLSEVYSEERTNANTALADLEDRLSRQKGRIPESLRNLREAYRQRLRVVSLALGVIDRFSRLGRRWRENIEVENRELPAHQKLSEGWKLFLSSIQKVWNFELFVALDSVEVDGKNIVGQRSITVGKVVVVLILLMIGFVITNWLARILSVTFARVLKLERPHTVIIRRTIRFIGIALTVVFSLTSVKIPLTIFAFLGGALAIGLGFGTQNLLKNFISGIIILFEKPFKIGHVLEIGNDIGTVRTIGIRSSVLRLRNGAEMLIPNSILLENNLINWTYSNRYVRFTIAIGVAYGCDSKHISSLLLDTVSRHGLVQKDPPPQVLFSDFGDNALMFEIRYWVDAQKFDPKMIASDLRHMIATAFESAHISVPFPQRDLHLDMPVKVEVQR